MNSLQLPISPHDSWSLDVFGARMGKLDQRDLMELLGLVYVSLSYLYYKQWNWGGRRSKVYVREQTVPRGQSARSVSQTL